MAVNNDRRMNERLQHFAIALEASKGEDDSYVESMIQKLGNVNSCVMPTSYLKLHWPELIGSTALHFAFKKEHLKAFQLLLNRGADYMLKNKKGLTIIHSVLKSAIESSRICRLQNPFIAAILKAHIENKQTANPCDPNGLSHFHAACMTNNVEAVEFFLDNGVPIDGRVYSNSPYFPSYTPLHFAVGYFSFQVVEVLLKHGASTYLKDAKGMTPLHLLLERNIEMFNKSSYTEPYAQEERDLSEKITRQLLQNIANRESMIIDNIGLSCLHVASAMMDSMEVEQLLKNNQNINHCINVESTLWPGYSALHFAAIFNINILKLLVKRGADLLAKNSEGVTPLDLCLERYIMEDIHDILSMNPSWKNIVFSDGKTKLLDLIAAMKSTNCFSKFQRRISKTKIITLPNDSPLWPGFTPMHLVVLFSKSTKNHHNRREVEKSYVEMISELHNRNMKMIETQDIHGRTPLHLCFWLGDMKSTIYLLLKLHQKLDNPLNLADENNLTILHIACADEYYPWLLKKIEELDQANLIEKLLSHSTSPRNNVNLAYKGQSNGNIILHRWTPLHVAIIRHKDSDVIRALLKYGADVNARDIHGITPVHLLVVPNVDHSVRKSKSAVNNILLTSSHLEESVAEDFGLSHLHIACFLGEVEAVKKLINSGADVNRKIKHLPNVYDDFERYYCDKSDLSKYVNNTPLHMALKSGRRNEAVDILIQRGADLFVENIDGIPLLYDAVKGCSSNFAELLRENADLQRQIKSRVGSRSQLHFACIMGDARLVQELLDHGDDCNATISLDSPIWPGCTPLHILMHYNQDSSENIRSVRRLLNSGADINAKIHIDSAIWPGCTPLLVLMQNFQYNNKDVGSISYVLKLLLDNGADVNANVSLRSAIRPGCTALHLFMHSISTICCHEHVNEILKLLLNNGADVTSTDAERQTPLHLANQQYLAWRESDNDEPYNYQRLRVLLRAQRDFGVNPASVEGISHFHIACSLAEVAVVEKFLKYGNVDVNGAIEFHLKHEDKSCTRDAGCTPLHLSAMARNNFEPAAAQFVDLLSQMQTVDLLMKHGADVHAEEARGRTPFSVAERFELHQILKRGGADVDAKDASGHTKLEAVVISRPNASSASDIIDLLRCGCRYNVFDSETEIDCIGLTTRSLPFAEVQKLITIALTSFPKVMETDESGRTAIHNLLSMYQLESWSIAEYAALIEQLAAAGCDIDHQDNLGRTALHLAVKFQNLRGISGLLLVGADIDVPDANGETAFAQINKFQSCTRCDKPTDAEDEQCQHYKVFKILALHIKKLQFCGLDVCQLNKNIAARAFPGFESLDANLLFIYEIEEMENTAIGQCALTFRDFMSELDVVARYPTLSQVKKHFIDEIFLPSESYQLREDFSETAGLLKLQYRKALMRPGLIGKSKICLDSLAGIRLPDICSYIILRFLKNSELKCMIEASGYPCLKSGCEISCEI